MGPAGKTKEMVEDRLCERAAVCAICLSTESSDSVYDAYVLFQQLETSGADDMLHPQPEAISDTWPGSHPAKMPGCHVVESDVTMTI